MPNGTLQVELDGQGSVEIPRRELWDVRVQLMAEADGDEVDEPGLGSHDVKTGIYEGGFKSWESSVDLVKVVLGRDGLAGFDGDGPSRVIEVRRGSPAREWCRIRGARGGRLTFAPTAPPSSSAAARRCRRWPCSARRWPRRLGVPGEAAGRSP